MSDWSLGAIRPAANRRLAPFVLVLLLIPLSALAATEASDLRQRLADDFEVLTLRDGLVFRPLDLELGITAIELIGDDLVVDGVSVSLDELEARLGERSAPIRQLLALEEDARRGWLAGGATAEAPVAPLPAEAEPETETEAGREGEEQERRDERQDRREERTRGRADTQVVVASSLTIEEDEVSRDVVVFGGSLTVEGRVIGNASAVGGSARVSGEIDGDLSVVGGSVTLEDGAEIRGDVVAVGGEVVREEGAIVHGQVLEVPFGPAVRIGHWDWDWDSDKPWHLDSRPWFSFSPLGYVFGIGWQVLGLAILALLACLVLLLAPGPVELVSRKAGEEPWKSGLVGLLSQILFVPILVIVCLILLISIVGIPLLILVPFAVFGLLLVAFLGYAAVAHRLGRYLEGRFGWRLESPYLALLVGFVAIQALSFLGDLFDFGWGPLWFFAAMFSLLGGLVCYVAWTVGFGAALLTRFGTASAWGEESEWMPHERPPSYTESAPPPSAEPPELPEDPGEAGDPGSQPPPEASR